MSRPMPSSPDPRARRPPRWASALILLIMVGGAWYLLRRDAPRSLPRPEAGREIAQGPPQQGASSRAAPLLLRPGGPSPRPEGAGPALRGVVFGEDGAALDGATVLAAIFDEAGNLPTMAAQTRTARDGRFSLPLSEGTYQISASKPGYGATSVLTRGSEDVTLVLQRSGAVIGHVRDEDGKPVPRFTLEVVTALPAHLAAPAPLWSRTIEDKDGAFRVDQLPDWAVILRASAPGRAAAYSPPLGPKPGETKTQDLVLAPGCTLEGTVVDARGAKVAYALVDAEVSVLAGLGSGAASTGGQVQTDQAGRFSLPHVAKGTILVRAHGGQAVATQQVEVQGCAGLAPVKLVLSEGGALAGVVRGADGEPIAGAAVTASHRSIGFRGARTDEAGRFRFEHLPAGKIRVELHHGGVSLVRYAEVRSGQTGQQDLSLPAAGRGEIRGRVTASGRPLPGARVQVAMGLAPGALDLRVLATAQDGTYRIPDLPPGMYLVNLLSTSRAQGAQVAPGGVVTLDLEAARPAEMN